MQTRYATGEEARVLVIAETGSCPLAWAASEERPSDCVLLVAQQLDEAPAEFARRAILRVSRLVTTGWRPRLAVFALGADAFSTSRAPIARALLATLQGHPDGDLLLAGRADFPPDARHELLILVQTLSEASLGRTGINVQFRDRAPALSSQASQTFGRFAFPNRRAGRPNLHRSAESVR